MAELTLDRDTTQREREGVLAWVIAHPEVVALVALMAVAAVLRFWALDAKAYHHDESLHAQFTWNLFEGKGYRHDPLMHGPFLFHTGAVVFFLFGDGDYTARILPALFGTILVGMPYLLRKQIGIKAVFIAAVFLTFSPTLLYFSRFYRNELYMAVWTFGIVICIWRYLDEQKPLYLYAMAALLAFSFCTKEVTFITAAVMLVFVNLMLAVELGGRREGENIDNIAIAGRTLLIAPFAWLIAAFWPLIGRQPFGRDRLPPIGDVLIVLGTLSLPQFAAGIQVITGDKGYNTPDEDSIRMTTVFALLMASAYIGLLWRPKTWLIVAVCFFVPYILLYTTFFHNQPAPWTNDFWHARGGFFSGIWGSLDYWLDQQHVRRGSQPDYYYTLMTPLYEFLPLLLSIGGATFLALRRGSFGRWLLFWAVGMFIALSLAGEKMPWLEVHIALPLIIAAAIALAGALDVLEVTGRRWLQAGAAALVAGAATLLLVESGSYDGLLYLGAALIAGLAGWSVAAGFQEGLKGGGRIALSAFVAVLLALTARAGIIASFENDDTPVEMLVYTQSSPEIPQLRDRIDTIARESKLGVNLPIVVDSVDGFSWPWAWYLRHYKSVSHVNLNKAGYQPPPGTILLVSRANLANVNQTGFVQTPYKHRWWFSETYRNLTLSDAVSTLTSWSGVKKLGDFFLHRRAVSPIHTGSVDSVAFFPDSLAAFDIDRAPARPVEPTITRDGRTVFGRPGAAEGEFQQPTDVFVDGTGAIWVADGRNNRIQKFDSAGNFVATISPTAGPARLNEPWSVAVDGAGFVYVADTWNHRILKFSPELAFIKSWGEPAVRPNPGPLELFGPRDIAIAPDGTLWVSDTGSKRLVHFDAEGAPLGTFGVEGTGRGQFVEQVGLAYDAQGQLYVADTWNGRIQRFSPDFGASSEFPVGWTSHEVIAKPYIAVLKDGRIVAAEPGKGVLLLFGPDGRGRGSWNPEDDSLPLGVAALPDGGFVFTDARRNEAQIVPAGVLDRLFK